MNGLRHYQRPERMDDPVRRLRFLIYRDARFAPTNKEARRLLERLRETERERDSMEGALRFILQNAEAWHGDDEAKGRALAVIAAVARDAIPESAEWERAEAAEAVLRQIADDQHVGVWLQRWARAYFANRQPNSQKESSGA